MKNHAVLNNINSKCSSSVCPQGHGLYRFESGVLCMLLDLSFFPSMSFFEIFSYWKGMICTLKVCSKNIGHYSHSRAKDNHTSLPGLFAVKQYHVLGICQCLFICTTGCAVQCWGISLRGYDGVKGFDIQINLTYFLQKHDYYTKSFNYYQL